MAAPLPSKEKVNNLMSVLNARKDMFRELLPKYLTPERLFRVAQIAMSKNPALLGCSPASFLIAMMDCAKSGLEPDGKHAAVVPYGADCNFQPMFQGLIKQAVRGGAAKKIVSRLVYENDYFRLWYDPEWHIDHKPATDDEGEVVGAYSYAVLPDGSYSDIEYMNKRKLDHIKGKSKARSGPWQTDPEEMYRKTPVKRLFKYLAVPEEVEYAVAADDQFESGSPRADIPLLEVVPNELQEKGKNQGDKIKERLSKKAQAEPNPTTPTPKKLPPQGGTGPVEGITAQQLEELARVPGDIMVEAYKAFGLGDDFRLDELDQQTAADLQAWVRSQ